MINFFALNRSKIRQNTHSQCLFVSLHNPLKEFQAISMNFSKP